MYWHALTIFAILVFVYYSFIAPNYSEHMDTIINKTRTVTLHYTNWCHYCKLMKPVWERVKASCKDSGIDFREVDEDIAKDPVIAESGYPTILMISKNGRVSKYPGEPDFVKLRAWVLAPERYDA